jgi:uncharacterized membrane protein YccC
MIHVGLTAGDQEMVSVLTYSMILIGLLENWIGGLGIFLGFMLYFLFLILWIRFSS